MWRTFVGGVAVGRIALARVVEPRAQQLQLAPHGREFLRELEHRLVLLDDVPLEVRDLLLEPSNVFVQLKVSPAPAVTRPP